MDPPAFKTHLFCQPAKKTNKTLGPSRRCRHPDRSIPANSGHKNVYSGPRFAVLVTRRVCCPRNVPFFSVLLHQVVLHE